MNVLLMN